MVKHTETIRRQQPTNCLSVFDHFVGLALDGLKQEIDCITSLSKNFCYTINIYNWRFILINNPTNLK